MKSLLLITFPFWTLCSCINNSSKNSAPEQHHSIPDESASVYNIEWSDSSTVMYAVDTFLSHKGKAFVCDSAIAVDYIGFLGEHTYMPINEKGQWINTIEKTKKLSVEQLKLIHSALGNKKSFEHPMMISCYEPRIGIVYFKNNKVIGQSAICLGCVRLASTAKLGNGDHYSSFNAQTLRQLEKLCSDLQFSNCKNW